MLNRFLPTTYPSTCYTCRQPTLDEVRIAIQKLRHGRVAGLDGLPPELIKCALLTYIWSSGKVPAEWKSDIILALYQSKGPRNECSRHRPITLLSVPSKVSAHTLLAQLNPLLASYHWPQQSGFTRGRSII